MSDVTARLTYKNVPTWHHDICCRCEEQASESKTGYIPQEEEFAKSNYNFEKPFLYLARKLAGDPKLILKAMTALVPPEIVIDPATLQQRGCILD